MKISFKKGKYDNNDLKILLETEGKEITTIADTAFHINQLACNEIRLGRNLFKTAFIHAMEDAEKGKDWAKKENENDVKSWFTQNKLPEKKFEKFLKTINYAQQERNKFNIENLKDIILKKKSKKLCVLDIETTSLNIEEAEIKFIGILDLQTNKNKIIQYKEPKEIIQILNNYDFIITFNGDNYDLPILKRHKINIPDYKHIDLYKVYKKKAPLLRSGGFKSYSLDNISKEIEKWK